MAKKTAKTAPRKSVRKKSVAKSTRHSKKKTTILVKYDCGFHNHLTIRGDGAGLSWFHGTCLRNIDTDEWIFEISHKGHEIEFKILINDQVFEIGENRKIKNGEKLTIHPKFH